MISAVNGNIHTLTERRKFRIEVMQHTCINDVQLSLIESQFQFPQLAIRLKSLLYVSNRLE